MRIEEIAENYIDDDIVAVNALGEGHINDTYLVVTPASRFICQRIKSGMDTGKLEHNFKLYSGAFRAAEIVFPDWLRNRNGRYFTADDNGDHYRMYPLIEGDILEAPPAPETLYACGQGLARMHRALAASAGTPKAVYPHLHDLNYYYERYKAASDRDNFIQDNRDAKIEAVIDSKIADMLTITSAIKTPIHGDPKLSNILIKDGEVVGFIDMDTVMLGSPLEDVADCIRSCCVTDGRLDREEAQTIADGYTSEGGVTIKPEVLKKVFNKICFELALRYYTDVISDAGYFKEHYPGDRLDKARSLIKTTWD